MSEIILPPAPAPPPSSAGIIPPSPDLSHLTDSERQIIESVMMRQKAEERQEAEVLKEKQDELYRLEITIRNRNEERKRQIGAALDDADDVDATCQICLKIKFADGIGHLCNYCGTRCCARCGGKVTLRSNKNIWVCILCRKKQELLIKTGNWIHSSMANRLKQLESETPETPLFERLLQFGGIGGTTGGNSGQQSLEKENYYSHQDVSHHSHHVAHSQHVEPSNLMGPANVCLNIIRRSSLGMITGISPKTHPTPELRRQHSAAHEPTSMNRTSEYSDSRRTRQGLLQFRANYGRSFDSTTSGPTPPPPINYPQHQQQQQQPQQQPIPQIRPGVGRNLPQPQQHKPNVPLMNANQSVCYHSGPSKNGSFSHPPLTTAYPIPSHQASSITVPSKSGNSNISQLKPHASEVPAPNRRMPDLSTISSRRHPCPSTTQPSQPLISNQAIEVAIDPHSSIMSHQMALAGDQPVSVIVPINTVPISSNNNQAETQLRSQSSQIVASTVTTTSTSTINNQSIRKLPPTRQKSRELPFIEDVLANQSDAQSVKSNPTTTSNMGHHYSMKSPKKQLPRIPTLQESTIYAKSTGNLYMESTIGHGNAGNHNISIVGNIGTDGSNISGTLGGSGQAMSNPTLYPQSSLPTIVGGIEGGGGLTSIGSGTLETSTSTLGTIGAIGGSGGSMTAISAGTDSGFMYSRSYSGETFPSVVVGGSGSGSVGGASGRRALLRTLPRPLYHSSTSTTTTSQSLGQFDSFSLSGPSTTGMIVRNDSLGSDPASECIIRRTSPIMGHHGTAGLASASTTVRTGSIQSYHHQHHHHRPRLRDHHRFRQYKSLSSSEDEIRSTPELSTEDDFDFEPDSISEPRMTHGKLRSDEILDQANMRNFLVHPISWKLSPDGSSMIGHMILKKHLGNDSVPSSSAAILGMKVIGGRVIDSGRLGARIERVKKGSIADTIGRLRPGDEVLEWNGKSLKGKTYEEVHDIIAESKQDAQVELLISRPTNKRVPLQTYPSLMTAEFISQQNRIGRRHTDVIPGLESRANPLDYDKNALLRGSSLGADLTARPPGMLTSTSAGVVGSSLSTTSTSRQQPPYVRVTRSPTINGRLQVKLWYDSQTLELIVTIISAIELSMRKTGLLRNPYVKCYLLPDRTEKTRRRTKTVVNSNEPIWNQTFIYSPHSRNELRSMAIELTLFDSDRYGSSEFLGQVVIELGSVPLDDEPEWFLLSSHEEIVQQLRHHLKIYYYNYHEQQQQRLSPSPTAGSRLSDGSDISELDYDDEYNPNSRESWRCLLADTSMESSIGSSGSPPLGTTDQSASASYGILGRHRAHSSQAYYGSRGGGSLLDQSSHSTQPSTATPGTVIDLHGMQSATGPGGNGTLPPVRGSPRRTLYGTHNVPFDDSVTSIPSGATGSVATHRLPPSHRHFATHHSSSFGGPASSTSPDMLMMRPAFRKATSQPTHRSVSPPLMRGSTPTQPMIESGGGRRQLPPFFRQNTVASMYGTSSTSGVSSSLGITHGGRQFKKRHLPSIPSGTMGSISVSSGNLPLQIGQEHGSMGLDLGTIGPPYSRNASTAYNTPVTNVPEVVTPLGMYSDSEVAMRPVFGNRPLYAHPLTRDHRHHTPQQHHNRMAMSRDSPGMTGSQHYHGYRSNDEMTYSRHTSSTGGIAPVGVTTSVTNSNTTSTQGGTTSNRRASHHHHHYVTPQTASQQQQQQQPKQHDPQSESDSFQSSRHHQRSHYHRNAKIDYRTLKNTDEEDDRSTTEYEEGSEHEPQHHHRQFHRKHSDPRRESKSAGGNGNGNGGNQSSSQSSLARRNSRGSRRRSSAHHQQQQQQQQHHPNDSEVGDVDSEETESSSKLSLSNQPGGSNNNGANVLNAGAMGQSTSSSAYTGRPKGSRTLSEFTGRSQQHSGPVHPPHPSRSSLAVARSLSERSKEPEMPHEDQSNESKSYADQIDEVMEQFNANCDISMDDLFGAANSASTSTLNASTSTDKDGKPIRSGKGKGNQSQSGLTKKSSSTSQLSVSGTKKRLGFRKKQATSFSVHRSEEVLPDEVRHLVKQPSSFSSDGETGSLSGDSSCAWMPTLRGGQSDQGEFSHFVEGLGPGQIVGRQALASPNMGEIQLTISEQKQGLEVEVIRARGLRQKSGVKVNPIPYAKVYLIRNRKCVSKAKTSPSARRTLDPLFQQSLLFAQPWKGCSLHVMIWGDYSRTDRKDFMGVVQIVLDNLDLGKTGPIMGWYKLFNQSSVTNLPTKGMSGTAAGPSGMSGGGGGGSISGSVSGVGGASLMSASMESFN